MSLGIPWHPPAPRPSPEEVTDRLTASRLSVVHLITGLTAGGAERHVESLLHVSRHDSQVLAVYRDGLVGQQLRAQGHRARSLDLEGLTRPTAVLRAARELRRLRPDVVHVHLLSAQAVGIPAARLARVPVIVSSEHSIMDDEVEGRPTTWRLKLLYRCWERLSTHTVAVSATTARRLREWGVADHRITVVENGIDFARLRFDVSARTAVRESLGIDPRAQVVGAVGRLDPVKRFPVLVRALAPWLAAGHRHLVIVGAGPQRTLLEDLAARRGVSERLHVVGARPDVNRLLSAFDVLASPSWDETFGIAVVEAVGNGLPVVYGQCPAIDDLGLSAPWLIPLPPPAGRLAGPRPDANRPDANRPDANSRDANRPDANSRDANSRDEEVALRAAVERAVALAAPTVADEGRRAEVPAALVAHYDVRRRGGEIDDLYVRLLRARGTPAGPGRGGGEPTRC